MKTTISVPDETFRRVDDAARQLGVSRSEVFTQAAERWLDELDDDGATPPSTGRSPDFPPITLGTDAAATIAGAMGHPILRTALAPLGADQF